MIDRADSENAVPALEMPPSSPSKRCHPVTKPRAVAFEPLRDAERATTNLGIVRCVHRPFDGASDDRPLSRIGRGMIDDAMTQKRPVLHQAQHWFPPVSGTILHGTNRIEFRRVLHCRITQAAVPPKLIGCCGQANSPTERKVTILQKSFHDRRASSNHDPYAR